MTELVRASFAPAGRATVTLASAQNRNALSADLLGQLLAHLRACEDDPAVRVVVLEAEGPTFCAGADLKAAASGTGMDAIVRGVVAVQRAIVAASKPVVARVHGAVRAGGLGLVAASDVAIGADDSHFALTEARLALAPAAISLTVLPRMTSRAAADTMLSGRRFDAHEAAAAGLLTRAVLAAELDRAVDAAVGELLTAHPQGAGATKQLLNEPLLERIDRLGERLVARSAELFASPAARETMTAATRRTT